MGKITFKHSNYNRNRKLKVPSNKSTRYTKTFWKKYEMLVEDILKPQTKGSIHGREMLYCEVAVNSQINHTFNASLIKMATRLFLK